LSRGDRPRRETGKELNPRKCDVAWECRKNLPSELGIASWKRGPASWLLKSTQDFNSGSQRYETAEQKCLGESVINDTCKKAHKER